MKKLIFGALLFFAAPALAFASSTGPTFSAQPTSGQAPLAVMFYTNFASGHVNFGDGTSSGVTQDCATGLNGNITCVSESYFVRHVYSAPGTYTAKLEGTYCPDSAMAQCAQVITTLGTVTITVSGSNTGTPSFSASPASGQAPLTVTFSPSAGFSSYYMVSFGDGTNANLQSGSVTHTYTAPGTYTARFGSDAPCLYGVPACSFAQTSYGSATVTVTSNPGTNSGTPWWWNQNPILPSCNNGWVYQNGACVYQPSTPTTPTTPTCGNGYVYQNGYCVYQPTTPTTPTSPTCMSGYVYQNGYCVYQQGTSGGSCSAITYNLYRGMRDTNPNGPIVQLQRFLASRFGLNQNDIATGYFGPLTQSYVMAFQREQGLDQVGIVGPYTRAAIWSLCR